MSKRVGLSSVEAWSAMLTLVAIAQEVFELNHDVRSPFIPSTSQITYTCSLIFLYRTGRVKQGGVNTLGLYALLCLLKNYSQALQDTMLGMTLKLCLHLALLVVNYLLGPAHAFCNPKRSRCYFDNPKLIEQEANTDIGLPIDQFIKFDQLHAAALTIFFLGAHSAGCTQDEVAHAFTSTASIAIASIMVLAGLGHYFGVSTVDVSKKRNVARFVFANAITCLGEEVLFRRLLQDTMQSYMGLTAIPVTALIFAIVHFLPAKAIYNGSIMNHPDYKNMKKAATAYAIRFTTLAALAGFAYGAAYAMNCSVASSTAVHLAVNAMHYGLCPYPASRHTTIPPRRDASVAAAARSS